MNGSTTHFLDESFSESVAAFVMIGAETLSRSRTRFMSHIVDAYADGLPSHQRRTIDHGKLKKKGA